MSRGHWLGIVVCAITSGSVMAQDRGVLPPSAAPSIAGPIPNPMAGPISTPNIVPPTGAVDPSVKDLTPPGFVDLIPSSHGANQGGIATEVPDSLQPFVPGKLGFYADAEFLLLRVRSDNLDYVIPNGTGGLATTGSIDSVEYKLAPGLHTELGYRFLPAWDITFGYTFVHTNGQQSVQAAPGEVLLPTLTRPGLTDTVLTASASAVLNYNVFDLVLGHQFVLDEHAALRVFGGLRFADIGQSLNGQYNGGDAQQAAVTTRSQFDGVGPLIGGEIVFAGWQGLHLYARASGGLIGGSSSNPLLETNDGGSTVYANVNYTVQKVVPVSSIGLGAGWEYKAISIRFGYEMTQWYGLTERVRLTDDVAQGSFTSRSGSLSLEGLFVQFAMKF
jgi:hypothetical protein